MYKRTLAILFLSLSLCMYQTPLCGVTNTVKAVSAQETQEKPMYEIYMEKYSDCTHGIEEWKKVDGKYRYPVTPDNDVWSTYVKVEQKYAACMIPQEILDTISTKDLLELVLDCPLLINLYAYDTYAQAVDEIANQFNGMAELIAREDCGEVVLDYYSAYEIPERQQVDYEKILSKDSEEKDYSVILDSPAMVKMMEEDTKVTKIIDLCETILAKKKIQQDMSIVEQEETITAVAQKETEKQKSEYFKDYTAASNAYLKTLVEEDGTITKKVSKIIDTEFSLTLAEVNNSETTGTLKTPSGNSVTYTIPSTVKKITDAVVSDYLNTYARYKLTSNGNAAVTCVANGTNAYNCYNYAWLYDYDRYANLWKKCRIASDSKFRNDPAYTYSNSAVTKYQIASYGHEGHAAVVVNTSVQYYDGHVVIKEPMVKSKWGNTGPLMKHPLSACPYPNTAGTLYYCY